MSEKYYVVSEEELKAALREAIVFQDIGPGTRPAEAACRARPVKPLYNFYNEITQWVDEED